MSRYSSDSESSNYHRKSRRKRRSSSSTSSSSNRHRRSESSKHRSSSKYKKAKSFTSRSYRRSRSRSKKSSRLSRSTSRDKRRRSHSKEKYRSKHYYKSRAHSKGHSSKYHSRSSSSDSKISSSTSSSSKSSSNNNKVDVLNRKSIPPSVNSDDQLREKLLKAIKAAESADHLLKEQGVLPRGIKSRNDINNLTPGKPQVDTLKEINAEEFVQKSFVSSKEQKEINPDELDLLVVSGNSNEADLSNNSVFHASFFVDQKSKLDRWVKKLYQIRQKAVLENQVLN